MPGRTAGPSPETRVATWAAPPEIWKMSTASRTISLYYDCFMLYHAVLYSLCSKTS